MRDEYETNRYDDLDLWQFSIGDLVKPRGYLYPAEGAYAPSLVVDRRVEGGYVEARPIKYQTWEKYRIITAGQSRWLNADMLEAASEESQHLT